MRTGAHLRAAGEAKGWGLRELARRTGITHRAVAYWEARASLDPRGCAVKRMPDALGVTLPTAPPLGEFLGTKRARGGPQACLVLGTRWALRRLAAGSPKRARQAVTADKFRSVPRQAPSRWGMHRGMTFFRPQTYSSKTTAY